MKLERFCDDSVSNDTVEKRNRETIDAGVSSKL